MARDPGSLWSPLVEWNDQGSYAKDKFIVHSTGSTTDSALGIFNYFNRPEVVVESTFVVGRSAEDPTRQLMDSSALADANLAANASGISVEVCGAGDEPFTDWQVAEVVRLGAWAHELHAIPHQLIPSPTGGGYGWHVMFGAPGPWTSVSGKVCPGQPRIDQLKGTIFPAIFGDKPVKRPVPVPAPVAAKPSSLSFNLPAGHYYGNITGPAASHGGYYASERAAVKVIQQWLIFRGCVKGVDSSRWATSTWADGVWGDPTDKAMALWHSRFYPGQPFPKQCWGDDLARLTA